MPKPKFVTLTMVLTLPAVDADEAKEALVEATDNGDFLCIYNISARPATKKEVKEYEEMCGD